MTTTQPLDLDRAVGLPGPFVWIVGDEELSTIRAVAAAAGVRLDKKKFFSGKAHARVLAAVALDLEGRSPLVAVDAVAASFRFNVDRTFSADFRIPSLLRSAELADRIVLTAAGPEAAALARIAFAAGVPECIATSVAVELAREIGFTAVREVEPRTIAEVVLSALAPPPRPLARVLVADKCLRQGLSGHTLRVKTLLPWPPGWISEGERLEALTERGREEIRVSRVEDASVLFDARLDPNLVAALAEPKRAFVGPEVEAELVGPVGTTAGRLFALGHAFGEATLSGSRLRVLGDRANGRPARAVACDGAAFVLGGARGVTVGRLRLR